MRFLPKNVRKSKVEVRMSPKKASSTSWLRIPYVVRQQRFQITSVLAQQHPLRLAQTTLLTFLGRAAPHGRCLRQGP